MKKKQDNSPRSEQINLRLTQARKEQLQEMSNKLNISLTELFEVSIDRYSEYLKRKTSH